MEIIGYIFTALTAYMLWDFVGFLLELTEEERPAKPVKPVKVNPASPKRSTQPTDKQTYTLSIDQCRVIDGDTIEVIMPEKSDPFTNRAKHGIRVLGIDCPELSSSDSAEVRAAYKAKAFVEALFREAKSIRLEVVKEDKYSKRYDGRFLLDGDDLATELIAAGHAISWDGKTAKIAWCDWKKPSKGKNTNKEMKGERSPG